MFQTLNFPGKMRSNFLFQATAKRTFDVQESVSISAVASCKKVNDEQAFPIDEPQVAGVVAPIHKPVTVVETIAEDSLSEIQTRKEERHHTSVSTTVTSLHSATASRTTVQVKEIEDVLETINVKEFGPWQAPIRELAKVDVLLRRGVTVDEVRLILFLFTSCNSCLLSYIFNIEIRERN